MWAGAPPFTAPTAQAVIAMRFTHRPPEVSSVRDGVPVWGSRAVAKALARDPAERYATAAQLAAALIAPEPGSPAEREAPTDKSIAVLPFTNVSSDPEIEYFGDGIAEEIINALAQLPGLRLAGRSSAFSFKGKREDLRVIGDKLSVGTVLEGSVRKAGAQLRITAQLVNVADGYHLWSALEAFRAAFELDPQYALASAGLADAYTLLGMYGVLSPRDALPHARAAARRSVELGPELAEAHNAVAGVRLWDWDWAGADREFRKALELNPGYVQARCWHGMFNL